MPERTWTTFLSVNFSKQVLDVSQFVFGDKKRGGWNQASANLWKSITKNSFECGKVWESADTILSYLGSEKSVGSIDPLSAGYLLWDQSDTCCGIFNYGI